MDDIVTTGPREIIDYKPTYILKPEEDERFYPSQVQKIAKEVLLAELEGKTYNEEESKDLSLGLCELIKERVKEGTNIPRYKIVVQVTIGEMRDQGVRVASRCLWDTSTDNYTSATYTNTSLWAVAIVFGCYTD
uniref:Uncharacterized protein n=1 Tax=Pinguiococcus pyrenoidosus TaxID=172671 RepID=A0A7R9YER0_9STRA